MDKLFCALFTKRMLLLFQEFDRLPIPCQGGNCFLWEIGKNSIFTIILPMNVLESLDDENPSGSNARSKHTSRYTDEQCYIL